MTVVEHAIAKGWIKRANNQVEKYSHLLGERRRRAAWIAQGLNSDGHPRKYKAHPELHGGARKTYRKRYYALCGRKRA